MRCKLYWLYWISLVKKEFLSASAHFFLATYGELTTSWATFQHVVQCGFISVSEFNTLRHLFSVENSTPTKVVWLHYPNRSFCWRDIKLSFSIVQDLTRKKKKKRTVFSTSAWMPQYLALPNWSQKQRKKYEESGASSTSLPGFSPTRPSNGRRENLGTRLGYAAGLWSYP